MNNNKKNVASNKYVSLLWLVFVMFCILIAYMFFSNKMNYQLTQLAREENSLRVRVFELEKEAKDLEEKLRLSQTNAFIENEARTRYGYLKPGEVRFVIANPEALYDKGIADVSIIE